MKLRYLLPRHYFVMSLIIILCGIFAIQGHGRSDQPLLVQTFESVTNPQTTYKLPCDLKFQLGKTKDGLQNTYGAWLQKKDGSLFLLRICTAGPALGMNFDGINIEILPKTEPHTKQFPKDFKNDYFFCPTVVPTPIQKPLTLAVGGKNIKLDMKLVHQVVERSNSFDGLPFCYKNISFLLRASESNELGTSELLPTPTPEVLKFEDKSFPTIRYPVQPLVPPNSYMDLPAFIKQFHGGFYSLNTTSYISVIFFNLFMMLFINPLFGILTGVLFFALFYYLVFYWLKTMRCLTCGHPIQHNQKFCGKCGYDRKGGG